jgi:hypothetical protein
MYQHFFLSKLETDKNRTHCKNGVLLDMMYFTFESIHVMCVTLVHNIHTYIDDDDNCCFSKGTS